MDEAGDRLRLLIVDDDEVDRSAVVRALRRAGFDVDVTEAADVRTALRTLLAEGRFDCVFLDYHLPDGDGLRVIRGAREAGIDTPFVVLTGQDDSRTAVEMMKAGASDYLAKSALSTEGLERSLRTAIRLHDAEAQARLALRALQDSEAKFRALHETSPDGFVIFRSIRDAAGRIEDFEWVYANPAAEQAAGSPPGGLVGRRLTVEYPAVKTDGLFDMYVQVVESGEPSQAEVEYSDQSVGVWMSITAVKLDDGVGVRFSDISRRKLAELEREQAFSVRDRFYAGISHELRTPINAILGYQDLLLAGVFGSLPEEQLASLEKAQRATRHLLDLINDILDFSKLEAGKVELTLQEVDVASVLAEIFSTLQPLAREANVEIRVSNVLCPDPLLTDPRRLRQILLNLLGNAIKYGGGQPIDVGCIQLPTGEIQIDVEDRGPGIAPEDIPRIFEEFVRLEEGSGGGTGLGLSISKRLAELLGGRLEVDSAIGRGSTFSVILPRAEPVAVVIATPERALV